MDISSQTSTMANNSDWKLFKAHKKAMLKALNKAHWTYVNGILLEGLENNETKPFWSYVKASKQDNVGVAPLKKDGVFVDNSKDKVEILSDQFQSLFTHEEDGAVPELVGQIYPTILIDTLIIRDE